MKIHKSILEKQYRCYPNHEKQYLFVSIPKNCSTTIRNITHNKTPKKLSKQLLKYKKFAVIRNPIERFVSGYVEAITRSEYDKKLPHVKIKDPIDKFLQFIEDCKHEIFDEHIALQSFYIKNFIPMTDFLLFENFKHDMKKINKKYKLNLNLNVHLWKKSKKKKELYTTCLKHLNEYPNDTLNNILLPDIKLYKELTV